MTKARIADEESGQPDVNPGLDASEKDVFGQVAEPVTTSAATDLPKNNLWIVMPCIGLVSFVASLDQSIISTALPTIATELNASPSEYSWIGTSYLLAQTIMTPINGRLTDIYGRKPATCAAISVLLIFSALCGAAQNVTWLIVARAFAGLGGGSIVSLSMIIISDIVPLHRRGAFQGYMGASYAVSGALGPVLGGILTEKTTWRWCFYINLPICGLALVLLYFSLHLPPPVADVSELKRTFDFVGLGLIVVAIALLVVGFSNAADHGFGQPTSYAIIIAGVVLLLASCAHFLTTKRNAIVPPRMFKNRTTAFFVLGSFFNSVMFMPLTFLLPQFFQGVRGSSTISSGVQLIPLSVSIAVSGILAREFTTRTHIIRPVIWVGFGLTSLGFGLLYALLTVDVTIATQSGLIVLIAIGVGLAITTPILVIHAAMPQEDMAAATSAWVLVRSFGATIAIFTAILNDGLRARFEVIDGYGTLFDVPTNTEGYYAIHGLPEGPLRRTVLTAFADSFRTCWIIGCALLAFSLALTLWTKSYSIRTGRGAAARVVDTPRARGALREEKAGTGAVLIDPVLPLSNIEPRGLGIK